MAKSLQTNKKPNSNTVEIKRIEEKKYKPKQKSSSEEREYHNLNLTLLNSDNSFFERTTKLNNLMDVHIINYISSFVNGLYTQNSDCLELIIKSLMSLSMSENTGFSSKLTKITKKNEAFKYSTIRLFTMKSIFEKVIFNKKPHVMFDFLMSLPFYNTDRNDESYSQSFENYMDFNMKIIILSEMNLLSQDLIELSFKSFLLNKANQTEVKPIFIIFFFLIFSPNQPNGIEKRTISSEFQKTISSFSNVILSEKDKKKTSFSTISLKNNVKITSSIIDLPKVDFGFETYSHEYLVYDKDLPMTVLEKKSDLLFNLLDYKGTGMIKSTDLSYIKLLRILVYTSIFTSDLFLNFLISPNFRSKDYEDDFFNGFYDIQINTKPEITSMVKYKMILFFMSDPSYMKDFISYVSHNFIFLEKAAGKTLKKEDFLLNLRKSHYSIFYPYYIRKALFKYVLVKQKQSVRLFFNEVPKLISYYFFLSNSVLDDKILNSVDFTLIKDLNLEAKYIKYDYFLQKDENYTYHSYTFLVNPMKNLENQGKCFGIEGNSSNNLYFLSQNHEKRDKIHKKSVFSINKIMTNDENPDLKQEIRRMTKAFSKKLMLSSKEKEKERRNKEKEESFQNQSAYNSKENSINNNKISGSKKINKQLTRVNEVNEINDCNENAHEISDQFIINSPHLLDRLKEDCKEHKENQSNHEKQKKNEEESIQINDENENKSRKSNISTEFIVNVDLTEYPKYEFMSKKDENQSNNIINNEKDDYKDKEEGGIMEFSSIYINLTPMKGKGNDDICNDKIKNDDYNENIINDDMVIKKEKSVKCITEKERDDAQIMIKDLLLIPSNENENENENEMNSNKILNKSSSCLLLEPVQNEEINQIKPNPSLKQGHRYKTKDELFEDYPSLLLQRNISITNQRQSIEELIFKLKTSQKQKEFKEIIEKIFSIDCLIKNDLNDIFLNEYINILNQYSEFKVKPSNTSKSSQKPRKTFIFNTDFFYLIQDKSNFSLLLTKYDFKKIFSNENNTIIVPISINNTSFFFLLFNLPQKKAFLFDLSDELIQKNLSRPILFNYNKILSFFFEYLIEGRLIENEGLSLFFYCLSSISCHNQEYSNVISLFFIHQICFGIEENEYETEIEGCVEGFTDVVLRMYLIYAEYALVEYSSLVE